MKLKIGQYTYTLGDLEVQTDHIGQHNYSKLLIQIKKDLPEKVRSVTLMHEILHALYSTAGYNFENTREMENAVDVLANGLVEFLSKNKKFVETEFLS